MGNFFSTDDSQNNIEINYFIEDAMQEPEQITLDAEKNTVHDLIDILRKDFPNVNFGQEYIAVSCKTQLIPNVCILSMIN